MVTFPDGAFVWDAEHLDGAELPFVFTDSPPMFLVVGGPDGLLVQGTGGLLAVLADGEATFVASGFHRERRRVHRSAPRRRPTGSRSWAAPARVRSPRAPASVT